ncbi:MAG: CocE/NonD family hydrolase [Candidatus Bathyarchaeota archaeon]|nr:CocE/NonD family hydrolase [Candidatus Bathyarchaeota archaeon]
MSRPEYEIIVVKDFMAPMRDGLKLATDIYRPAMGGEASEGRFPAILERTPYNKERKGNVEKANYFVKRGYVLVAQDCRGRFKSEGEFYGYANEPPDGYDTVEWIAGQPWSDGKVGTMGTSYGGWVQSALALLDPPHLASMFPNVSIFNAGLHSVRHAGAFEMRWLAWSFGMAADSKEAAGDPVVAKALIETRFDELISRWPLKKGETPISLTPNYERFAFDILTHSDYHGFWRRTGRGWMGDVEEHIGDHADVPMFYSGGWYDSYCRSTTELYSNMSRAKIGPVKLIMGPWTHGDSAIFARTHSGDVDFGPDAAIDYNGLRLRWFDRTLKGIKTGILDEPPVRIFVMGGGDGKRNREGRLSHGGRWRYENEWPITRTMYTNYYIHGGGLLDPEPPDREGSSTSYVYDPEDPVPTIGGNLSALTHQLPVPKGYEALERLPNHERKGVLGKPLAKVGAHNQVEAPDVYGARPPYLPLSSRRDVLVFQTPPLEGDVEVTGPLRVDLWASSSCVDTDFTAKLIDVHPPNENYPNGYAMNLADSIIRARYRGSFERPELMEPGEVYRFTIRPYPTSNLFMRGHRIRLDVSSSNWPRFDINPNTGEPLGLNTRTMKATNTIYHEAARPSHIVLPIIPK